MRKAKICLHILLNVTISKKSVKMFEPRKYLMKIYIV